jgi:WD40 repeat protein
VTCLSPLYRNREALLSGLAQGGKVLGLGSKNSISHLAAAYLWDLRKPRRPASSLNFAPAQPAAASEGGVLAAAGGSSAGSTGSSGSSTAASGNASGAPGLLCLSVHEDGALAAGGCRDGRVLIWDMRKVIQWLSHNPGHTCTV